MVAVAEELHFGRAAKRLHISQPPLSRQVRDLEWELGVELFHRTRRTVRLTPAGETLLEEARQLLARLDRAIHRTQLAAEGRTGRLSIGFSEAAIHSGLLPLAVGRYRERFPEVAIELTELVSKEQPAALREGRIDVAFAYVPPAAAPLFVVERLVLHDRLVMALPSRSPGGGARRPSVTDLRGATLILFRRDLAPALHDDIRHSLRQRGLEPARVQEVVQTETALAFVAAGIGIALVPQSIASVGRAGVSFLPVRGLGVRLDTHLVWRRANRPPALASFLDEVRAAARKLRATKG